MKLLKILTRRTEITQKGFQPIIEAFVYKYLKKLKQLIMCIIDLEILVVPVKYRII